jgi:acyl-CoA synthetase (AMP-forming)/AMP-acid ligase II
MGARKGDVMSMILPNIPEFPIAFLGACGVGVVLSPMNPLYTPGNGSIIL